MPFQFPSFQETSIPTALILLTSTFIHYILIKSLLFKNSKFIQPVLQDFSQAVVDLDPHTHTVWILNFSFAIMLN